MRTPDYRNKNYISEDYVNQIDFDGFHAFHLFIYLQFTIFNFEDKGIKS